MGKGKACGRDQAVLVLAEDCSQDGREVEAGEGKPGRRDKGRLGNRETEKQGGTPLGEGGSTLQGAWWGSGYIL